MFLDKESDVEENYKNLIDLFTNYKIIDNQYELKSLLYLISNVSNNHYQTPSFVGKIERLLQYLNEDIKKNFSNLKIFDIFHQNKLILLILIDQKIMTFDQSILKRISSEKYFKRSYHHFFFPEIHPLIKNSQINVQNSESRSIENVYEEYDNSNNYEDNFIDDNDTIENFDFYQSENFINFVKEFSNKLPDNFFKQRKIGQNENFICKLIREDLIDEFITYVNQHDYSLNSNVDQSIYETNSFLIKKRCGHPLHLFERL